MGRFLYGSLFIIFLAFPLTSICAEIGLNEVYYHDQVESQWIEIYNSGAEQIDMSGWVFSRRSSLVQGEYFVIPEGTVLPAQRFLLLCADIGGFKAKFNVPGGVEILEYLSTARSLLLQPDGDDIYLLNADGVEVDLMWYGDGGDRGPFQSAPSVGPGHSLGRFPDGEGTGVPSADFYDYRDPTPGARNPPRAGIDRSTWGKIKAMYSVRRG